MESACLRQTEIPGTSALYSDYQYHFDRLARFYTGWPGDFDSYARSAAAIQYPDERRAALIEAIRADNEGNPALEQLAKPGTVAVVTGQQVGLFSGPAYTVYKALTAARLARCLAERGIAAVPIFWVATEDHDFAEVNHAFVFDHRYESVRLEVPSAESQRPVGGIAIEQPPIEQLRAALGEFPFGEEVLALVEEAYQPGATMGQAFEGLLRKLLAKWGLLYVDPLNPALRRIAAPLLRDALIHSDDLKNDLLRRNQELVQAGYHAQVHIEPRTSLFFLLDEGRRIALRRQNGDYASKDRAYTISELSERAADLSPNALLRPVMQDYLLPTVTYVGGPSELAYLAQSQVIYQSLLGRMPVMTARGGFTILDHRAAKLLDRYQMRIPMLFQPEAAVQAHIASKLIPSHLVEEFEAVRQKMAQSLDRLRSELLHFDRTLADALKGSQSKILYQLAKMEAKTAREAMRRDERAAEEARYLIHLIYPHKHLQERFYSILPFLARHGFGLLDTLYDRVDLECPDHKILVV